MVINGRDERQLEKTAAEIRAKARGKINAVAADVSTPDGQAALFKACPEPDILTERDSRAERDGYAERDVRAEPRSGQSPPCPATPRSGQSHCYAGRNDTAGAGAGDRTDEDAGLRRREPLSV